MNWVDIAILGIIAISALLSLLRGFIKEVLSLATWIIALWASFAFFETLAPSFDRWIELPSARAAAAFVCIFLGVLAVGALVGILASKLVRQTGLSGTDRMVGILFGVARGALIVGVLVLLAGLTAVPQDPWWQESRLMIHFEQFALWLRELLPPEFAANIRYD